MASNPGNTGASRDRVGGAALPNWTPTSVEAFLLEKTFLEDVVRPLVRALVHSRLQTAGLAPGTAPGPTLQRELLSIRDSLLTNIGNPGSTGSDAVANAAAAAAAAAAAVTVGGGHVGAGTSSASNSAAINAASNRPSGIDHISNALINNAPELSGSSSGDARASGPVPGSSSSAADGDADMSVDSATGGDFSALSFDLSQLGAMRQPAGKLTPALRKRSATRNRTCAGCGIPHNNKFRRGPHGPGTLCDKCGSKWKKIADSAKADEALRQQQMGSTPAVAGAPRPPNGGSSAAPIPSAATTAAAAAAAAAAAHSPTGGFPGATDPHGQRHRDGVPAHGHLREHEPWHPSPGAGASSNGAPAIVPGFEAEQVQQPRSGGASHSPPAAGAAGPSSSASEERTHYGSRRSPPPHAQHSHHAPQQPQQPQQHAPQPPLHHAGGGGTGRPPVPGSGPGLHGPALSSFAPSSGQGPGSGPGPSPHHVHSRQGSIGAGTPGAGGPPPPPGGEPLHRVPSSVPSSSATASPQPPQGAASHAAAQAFLTAMQQRQSTNY